MWGLLLLRYCMLGGAHCQKDQDFIEQCDYKKSAFVLMSTRNISFLSLCMQDKHLLGVSIIFGLCIAFDLSCVHLLLQYHTPLLQTCHMNLEASIL